VQPGADHEPVERQLDPARRGHQDLRTVARDPGHLAAQQQRARAGSHVGRQRPGDRGEVDDRRLRGVQRRDPGHVRLDLGQCAALQPA
jgi:hypothetical protein